MGNIIGILSTVILVSTLATLIFAVIAYVLARRRRSGIEDESGGVEEIPDYTEPLRESPESERPPETPPKAASPASGAASRAPAQKEPPAGSKDTKPLFRQLTAHGDKPLDAANEMDKKTGWDWE